MLGGYLQWTSIPSRGSSNTPSHFMLSSGGVGYWACLQEFTYFSISIISLVRKEN